MKHTEKALEYKKAKIEKYQSELPKNKGDYEKDIQIIGDGVWWRMFYKGVDIMNGEYEESKIRFIKRVFIEGLSRR
jgi:hypothetical protein